MVTMFVLLVWPVSMIALLIMTKSTNIAEGDGNVFSFASFAYKP